ncbi:Sec-independent protein translocase protein TatB [Spongiibacter taiwanensis]|uniref:Sec-independent protein translocase protein TatB n=1 Tax=Spongiibacter taiwanensis TaxID=1748242 RepID=UPI002035E0BA|nr:Sec-independent protein translocase protein TatB [Spongiibacter taiwanensis]USA42458.1 Sec-independent protein translocase protein TatB [Spongiibacter taiwanensis]
MFDIGFAELLLIAVVGLLVLGPERLPGAVRTTSLWIGRLRRSFNNIRKEIEREVGADEIRQQLHNESIMASLKEGEQKLRSTVERTNRELRDIEKAANTDIAAAAPQSELSEPTSPNAETPEAPTPTESPKSPKTTQPASGKDDTP